MDIVSSRSFVTRAVGVAAGQADGIQPRTIEVLQVRWRGYGGRNVRLTVPQSYGLAEPLIRIGAHFPRAVRSPRIVPCCGATHTLLQSFWNPGPDGNIMVGPHRREHTRLLITECYRERNAPLRYSPRLLGTLSWYVCTALSGSWLTAFQITRHQGGIEALFHGSMGAKGLHVQRSTIPTAIQLSSDPSALKDPKANPVKVSLLLTSSSE